MEQRMTAAQAMRRAVWRALEGSDAVRALVHGVGDGPVPRGGGGDGPGAVPGALVGQADATGWGTCDRAGAEVMVQLVLADRGPDADRLGALTGAAERAIEALAGSRADGWEVAAARVMRVRVERGADGARGGRSTARVAARLRCLVA